MFIYKGPPWWLLDFNAWRMVTGRMTVDERWELRDKEQDERNKERYRSFAMKVKFGALNNR